MSVSLLPPRPTEDQNHSKTTGVVKRPQRSMKAVVVSIFALLALLLVLGVLPRLKRQNDLSAAVREQQDALPMVSIVKPHEGEATNELLLPATTQGIQEMIVFARRGGYVKRWLTGMGQDVRAGQLLAEINAPETAQEVRQARQEAAEADQTTTQARAQLSETQAALEQAEAALKQARTNVQLARVNLERSKTLVAQGIVSNQDLDDKQALYDARQSDVEVAQANIRARQAAIKAQQSVIGSRQSGFNARSANVQRIMELQSYENVTAPFAGTITARNIEVGTLIGNNGSPANGNGLYRLSRLDTIRVFINVPQTYVAAMKPGLETAVLVKELPQKTFTGKVIGTSHSIDPATRTLMVEVRVPNPTRELLPGMYAQVRFALPLLNHALLVPASALVVNTDGTQVLTLRADKTVQIHKVEVGRDFGKEIEIVSGLKADDDVISNPTDALHDGTHVQVMKPEK